MLSHFSCVRIFATPGTVACQAPLSMGFSRQEYWSGFPRPPPSYPPKPGIKPVSLASPTPRLLKTGFQGSTCTWVSITALCTIAEGEKNSHVHKWSSRNTKYNISVWLNSTQPRKRNAGVIHATTWVTFDNILFGERCKSHKATYFMVPTICVLVCSRWHNKNVTGWAA